MPETFLNKVAGYDHTVEKRFQKQKSDSVTKQSTKTKSFNVNNQKCKKKKRTKTKLSIQIMKNAEETGTNDKTNTYILSPYDLFSRELSRNTK